ncbi:IS630 family transposase [Frankia sp. Cpl3]|nr:IS630 family transposase [Frankia sp. Cpl3]
MVSRRAAPITLTDADRVVLTARVRSRTVPRRDWLRARIVLAAADGAGNTAIAVLVGVCPDTVSTWRGRFARHGLAGLVDLPRSGRPRRFTPVQVAQVKALACTRPADLGVPLERWSATELAAHATAEGIVETVSASSVTRWLAADAIRPWQHRSWIFPRDPDFVAKASRVLDLYERRWDGRPLTDDDYVISADEKSQLQALRRAHPTRPAGPGHGRRVEFEYRRGGTIAYFAAYDVHRGQVTGRVEEKTGIVPFGRLVDQVMTQQPYAGARRVFWVVDNGCSHNGRASVTRMRAVYPNAHLVHLPVHASWLNQIEIYFSILQRKAITRGDFTDLDDLAARVIAFQARYNHNAQPFDWTYTRADLLKTARRFDLAA